MYEDIRGRDREATVMLLKTISGMPEEVRKMMIVDGFSAAYDSYQRMQDKKKKDELRK